MAQDELKLDIMSPPPKREWHLAEDDPNPANRFLANAWGGNNVALLGMAGTGKSTLLREFITGCIEPLLCHSRWEDGSFKPIPDPCRRQPQPDVTAPTGIAALNVGGNTIHRFCGMLLGPRKGQDFDDYFHELERKPFPSVRQGFSRVQECECLVIDEISMMSGTHFGFVDYLFKRLRGSDEPFGGCQVIVIGDFLQLPPVRTDPTKPYDWAFQSPAWHEANFKHIVLNKVHRQTEELFLEALHAVRTGQLTGRPSQTLHSRITANPEAAVPRLYTHNSMVNKWNGMMLADIEAPEETFMARTSGNPFSVEFLRKNLLCPEELHLKVGARVMTTINDRDRRFVNGTTGYVTDMDQGYVTIDPDKGAEFSLARYNFSMGEGPTEGHFEQFPIRLAWAMTIHKSQGLTLDSAYVDIRAARECGQAYTALSRIRTLKGLMLKDWFRGVFVSREVLDFYNKNNLER